MERPLWVEINLSAISANLKQVRKVVGKKVKIVPVLKQFAYAHGLIPVGCRLKEQGVDFLGVGSIAEGAALRANGYRGRIIFLSIASKEFISDLIEYEVTPTVADKDFIFELNKQAKKKRKVIPVHIKIDTGMGRLGFYPEQTFSFLEKIKNLKFIFLEGIYTHFPVADVNSEFTLRQIEIFNQLIQGLKARQINFKYCHCANSAGIAGFPRSHFNMVRPGLIIYGVKPYSGFKLNLTPALSLKAKIIFVKDVFAGQTVGYGSEFVAASRRRIATVAIGYADGYPWALSSKSKVLIKGNFFNIAGRVCMDHIMVDLKKNKDIKSGDTVTLIGEDRGKLITVEDLAAWAQTIPYEILTGIPESLARHYRG